MNGENLELAKQIIKNKNNDHAAVTASLIAVEYGQCYEYVSASDDNLKKWLFTAEKIADKMRGNNNHPGISLYDMLNVIATIRDFGCRDISEKVWQYGDISANLYNSITSKAITANKILADGKGYNE